MITYYQPNTRMIEQDVALWEAHLSAYWHEIHGEAAKQDEPQLDCKQALLEGLASCLPRTYLPPLFFIQ